MKVSFAKNWELEVFQLEEFNIAKDYAQKMGGEIYSWKTIGHSNWLEKSISIADVLGLVVLQENLPDWIDLPDDTMENGNDDESR